MTAPHSAAEKVEHRLEALAIIEACLTTDIDTIQKVILGSDTPAWKLVLASAYITAALVPQLGHPDDVVDGIRRWIIASGAAEGQAEL